MADNDTEPFTAEQMEQLQAALGKVAFARLLGIELIAAQKGSATLRLSIKDNLKQIDGVMHGGATASLIDTATAFAILPFMEGNERFTTVELAVNYLRPLVKGYATVEARVLRAGRRLMTVAADVRNDDGKLAATALSTYLRFVEVGSAKSD